MTDYIFQTSSGEEIPVIIDTRRGLRNITLRPKTRPNREIHISKPWLATTASALRFLEQKRRWVERIFNAAPEKIKIQDGDEIEFLGRRVKIQHNSSRRGNLYIKNENQAGDIVGPHLARGVPAGRGVVLKNKSVGETSSATPPLLLPDGNQATPHILIIGGAAEHLERRVRDFIKNELLSEIKQIIKTTPHEFHPLRIALRDTTSRWGSCSTTGTVSFSWRLALAPYSVMRYVVMHELAHKKHMDHSPQFWATVNELYGDPSSRGYDATGGVGRAKRWLTQYGATLHQYF